jgi:hypothetical protein
MRRTLALLMLVASATTAAAQRDSVARQLLPRDVRREATERWNAPVALRSNGPLEIGAGREVRGDVAVLGGPLVIGGLVTGNVLAINSDVTLQPGARIDGDVLVVGGSVTGRNDARVGGSTRIYREWLRYREDGDHIVASDESGDEDEGWWRRLERRHEGNWAEALRIVQAGPYNRVEGLPIELGPVVHRRTPWGSVRVDAAAVVRTGSSFDSDRGDVGHKLRGEVRVGRDHGIGVGASAFNVVDPVESWQLSDLEVALAAFVAKRDYRDYFERHGGNAFITLFGARNLDLTGSFGEERWSSRTLRNPLTIFRGDDAWRPNPAVDEGLFHIGTLSLQFDTRTDPDDPWSGWYANANVEHGRGHLTSVAPTSQSAFLASAAVGDAAEYTRGLMDLRRYNRLGPSAQLDMRVVLGGWLGGDPLPLERRLSVDGPGTLPGYGFRELSIQPDVGTCSTGVLIPGHPAECDRIALAQVEYRGDLRINFTGNWEDWPRHYHTAHGDAAWVMFIDAGRGWNVGDRSIPGTYGSNALPPLSTFRSDIGLGLDIAGIGVYAAKAVSHGSEPVNFFVRLRHRF